MVQAKNTTTDKPIIRVGAMDYTIYFVVIILAFIGVLMVFSASYMTAANSVKYHNDPFHFLKRQGLFALMGLCGMHIMSNVSYRFLKKFAFALYMLSNVLLVIVQFVGITSGGATRWLPAPIIGQFQPSELAKVAIILYTSYLISNNKNILLKWPSFLFCCFIVMVTVALVAWGNFSTAIVITLVGIGIIFVACPYILRFILAGAAGVAALTAYLAFFAGEDNFRTGRFYAWLNPFADQTDKGYQVVQSLFAVASGGMFGLGPGQSRQKTFLPEAHNDIIFSIICEELGFVGAAIIIILFAILVWRGIKVALETPDTFGSLVATGIVLLVAFQVIINIAVVTNTIPNTGIPLPFISYGGTAIITFMGLMGVLLNISRHTK